MIGAGAAVWPLAKLAGITRRSLNDALRLHTESAAYLKALITPDAVRVDLAGEWVEFVSDEHRARSLEMKAERERIQNVCLEAALAKTRADANAARESEENIMTIFALCVFSGGLPETDSDAGAEALRAAGYEVIRLPPELKATLQVKGDDYIEVRREGSDDEASREAMDADINRILSPFGGEINGCGMMTIAEMWAPPAWLRAKPPGRAHVRVVGSDHLTE